MSEDRRGIRTVIPESNSGGEPIIQTKFHSHGTEFWYAIPAEVRELNAPIVANFERDLLSLFPDGYVSPGVKSATSLSLLGEHERQFDHESCTYHASANALRILAGADPAYSKEGLKERLSQIYGRQSGNELTKSALIDILSSGEPFNKLEAFQLNSQYDPQASFPTLMHKLMVHMYNGAVLLDSWPFSPEQTIRNGIDYIHARTIAGFSTTNHELFFHVIDPYDPKVKPWSLRDYITAKRFQYANFPEGLRAKDLNDVAKDALIIRKKGAPIITTVRS